MSDEIIVNKLIRFISLCCIVMLLVGCAGKAVSRRAPRYPNPETPEAKVSFNNAYNSYIAGRFGQADAAFGNLISEYPYTELTDRARFYRGEMAFSRENYDAAILFYRQSYAQVESPAVAPLARFKGALSLHRLGRNGEAISLLKSINRKNTTVILRLRIDSLGVIASRAMEKSPNDCVLWSLRLLDDYAEGAGGKVSGIATGDVVSDEDALADVRRFVGDETVTPALISVLPLEEMRGKRSGGYLDYKHAYELHRRGDTVAAFDILKVYPTRYPKHEYYSAAGVLMTELGGVVGEGAGIKLGVILPLTGRYAVYGESVLHGLECAMGIYAPCVGPAGMKLLVRDSAREGVSVAGLVDELAGEGVVAIVGLLLSKTVVEAATRAQAIGVPLVSLSQREGIAEVGDYIFRNNVSTSSEVATLVDFIFSRKHMRRFFVMYPDNRKGAEYRRLFEEAVTRWGGEIVGEFAYAPNQMEFGSELRGSGMTGNVAGLVAETRHYDAIFIPDSYDSVGYIIPTLALMGVRKVQLLGISRWDDPQLVARGGEFVEGAIFVDSFYKKAKAEQVSIFVSRFAGSYGIEPTLLEAMGYDTMRMIMAVIQRKGAMKRDTLRDALARTNNFPGVAGRISFDSNGDSSRAFHVLTVKNGEICEAE